MNIFKKYLIKLLDLKPEHVYVPDYRGRIVYQRLLIDKKGGIYQEKGLIFTNTTNTKKEIVIYEYLDNKKYKA